MAEPGQNIGHINPLAAPVPKLNGGFNMASEKTTCTLLDCMVSATQQYLYNRVCEYLNSAMITEEEYMKLYNRAALESAPDTPLLSSVDDIYTEKNDQDMLICAIVWGIREPEYAPILNIIS